MPDRREDHGNTGGLGGTRLGLRLPWTGRIPVGDDPPSHGDSSLTLSVVGAAARAAEVAGFDTLWVPDRLPGRPDPLAPRADGAPVEAEAAGQEEWPFEAYSLLGALAEETQSIRIGALATPASARPPSVLAKIVTTLDVLSAGRSLVALTADASLAEPGDGSERPGGQDGADRSLPGGGGQMRSERRMDGQVLSDALRIARAMFTEEEATVSGRWFSIDGAANRPQPARAGGVPLFVACVSGDETSLRVAAELADGVVTTGDAATLRADLDVLADGCASLGRDPAAVTCLCHVPVDLVTAPWRKERTGELVDQVAVLLGTGADGVVLEPVGLWNEPDGLRRATGSAAGDVLSVLGAALQSVR